MFVTTSRILHGAASIAMRMSDVDPAGDVWCSSNVASVAIRMPDPHSASSSVFLLCRCPYLAGTQEAVLQEGQAELRAVNDHQQRQASNFSTHSSGMYRPGCLAHHALDSIMLAGAAVCARVSCVC